MNYDKARIWFFTDIHGSNMCFRKFLNLVNNKNRPNVLIIGGDITGKQIVPIIEDVNNTYLVPMGGKNTRVKDSELTQVKEILCNSGYYPYECSIVDYKKLSFDSNIYRSVFDKLVADRLKEWVKLADEKLPSQDVCKVIINAGNDDPIFVDDILDKCTKIIRPEGKIVEINGGLKLLSTGYTIKTPWPCPRDTTEEELQNIIASMTSQLTGPGKLVFNFHCPPINSSLDIAHKINEKTLVPESGFGKAATKHVGSISVRKAIEHWRPSASLHGHIHEVHVKEKIKETFCFNPGTDFQNGKLQGAFLIINEDGVVEYENLTKEIISANQAEDNAKLFGGLLSLIPGFGRAAKDYVEEKTEPNNEKKSK